MGPGSVSVIDFATRKVVANWPIPGGGSPDMGNVSADGKNLWLSGRYHNVVYAFDTTTGAVTKIPVGQGAARADRVAAAGPLFARPHRQHAIAAVATASRTREIPCGGQFSRRSSRRCHSPNGTRRELATDRRR